MSNQMILSKVSDLSKLLTELSIGEQEVLTGGHGRSDWGFPRRRHGIWDWGRPWRRHGIW